MQRFTCTWKCKGLHVYGRIIKIKYCCFWCSISLQAKVVFFDEACLFIQFENNEVVWKKHYSNPFTTEFLNFRKYRLYTGKWNRLALPNNLEFMHCKEPQFLKFPLKYSEHLSISRTFVNTFYVSCMFFLPLKSWQ